MICLLLNLIRHIYFYVYHMTPNLLYASTAPIPFAISFCTLFSIFVFQMHLQ